MKNANNKHHINRESAMSFKNNNLIVDVNSNFMPENVAKKLNTNPASMIASEILSPISIQKEMEAVTESPKFIKEASDFENDTSSSFSKKK